MGGVNVQFNGGPYLTLLGHPLSPKQPWVTLRSPTTAQKPSGFKNSQASKSDLGSS